MATGGRADARYQAQEAVSVEEDFYFLFHVSVSLVGSVSKTRKKCYFSDLHLLESCHIDKED